MSKIKSENLVVMAFGAIFLFSIIMIFSQAFKITGYATTATTTSNVTISTFFAVAMSTNLSDGIRFGNLTTLPVTNQNASHNYDGTNTTMAGNGTSMWMNVSTDSNTAVNFCIKADDNLRTSGGDVLTAANESWHNHSSTNLTLPNMASENSLTTSYAQAGANVAAGGTHYYRFWLDVPAGQASGTYNNTISFKGVTTGGAC